MSENIISPSEWNDIVQDIAAMDAETLSKQDIIVLSGHVDKVLNYFKGIREDINTQVKVRRLSSRAKEYGLGIEQFLNLKDKSNRSSIKTVEQYKQATTAVQRLEDLREDKTLKSKLLQAKEIIMTIRNLITQSTIQYNLFIIGEYNGQEVIQMGQGAVEQLVSSDGALASNLSLNLSYTSAQVQALLNNTMNESSVLGQWQNILTPERERAWQVLKSIREKVKTSKQVYLNYGELLEALIHLDKLSLNAVNVYNAIMKSLNTLSFESGGDFVLEGQNIQAKVLNTYGAEEAKHRIRYISVSNIVRVLTNIQQSLKGNDVNQIKNNLMQLFINNDSVSKISQNGERELKQIVEKILAPFET